MKNYIKSTIVATTMLFAMTSFANQPKSILSTGNEAKTLLVELVSGVSNWKVKLTDSKERIIYMENISEVDYIKQFDLNDLEVGTYNFIIETPLKYTNYTLHLNDSELKVVNKKDTGKPIFRKVDNKVYVSLFNGYQQKVTIEIVDSSNNIFFKGSIKDDLNIRKAINFENAVKGSYTITVAYGNEVYYKNIVIG